MIDSFVFPSKHAIVFAPHCDDELIGCSEVFDSKQFKSIHIVYTTYMDDERKLESIELRDDAKRVFNKEVTLEFLAEDERYTIETSDILGCITKASSVAFFPSRTDNHPDHVYLACLAENLSRQGLFVVFYTTAMNVPWIHKADKDRKKFLLDFFYPSQSDLWKFEYKYFLFEGYNIWL